MEKNSIRLFVGILAITFGLWYLYKRLKAPESFVKLQVLQKQWGEKGGNLFHLVAYVSLPIILGILLVIKSYWLD